MEFEHFKAFIRNKNKKLKQIHIVWLCLNYVEFDTSRAQEIGCLWNSDSTFLINTSIFGIFIGRLPNTINRSFRCHKFTWQKSSALLRSKIPKKFDFKKFPDQLNWIQRQCEGFTKKTTENEAILWKYHNIIPKKHIKTDKTKKYKRILPKKQIKQHIIEENSTKNINSSFTNEENNDSIDFSNLNFETNDFSGDFEKDFQINLDTNNGFEESPFGPADHNDFYGISELF